MVRVQKKQTKKLARIHRLHIAFSAVLTAMNLCFDKGAEIH